MAERFQKSIKVSASISEAMDACKRICANSKMDVKEANYSNTDFFISASEKTNWLSTSWPTKIEIKGTMYNEKLIIDVTSSSKMGSITQGNANARKMDGIVDSINAYLE